MGCVQSTESLNNSADRPSNAPTKKDGKQQQQENSKQKEVELNEKSNDDEQNNNKQNETNNTENENNAIHGGPVVRADVPDVDEGVFDTTDDETDSENITDRTSTSQQHQRAVVSPAIINASPSAAQQTKGRDVSASNKRQSPGEGRQLKPSKHEEERRSFSAQHDNEAIATIMKIRGENNIGKLNSAIPSTGAQNDRTGRERGGSRSRNHSTSRNHNINNNNNNGNINNSLADDHGRTSLSLQPILEPGKVTTQPTHPRRPSSSVARRAHLPPIKITTKLRKTERGFNQYSKIKLLGQGATAKVYLYADMSTGTYYAVKKYNRMLLKKQRYYANDPQTKRIVCKSIWDKVENELNVLKYIHSSGHEKLGHICRVYEIVDDPAENSVFMVMEYASKGSLCTWNDALYTFDHASLKSEEQARVIFLQILQALEGLREIGVIHRDIKPDNIVIFEDGGAKLIDFGDAIVLPWRYPEVMQRNNSTLSALSGLAGLSPIAGNPSVSTHNSRGGGVGHSNDISSPSRSNNNHLHNNGTGAGGLSKMELNRTFSNRSQLSSISKNDIVMNSNVVDINSLFDDDDRTNNNHIGNMSNGGASSSHTSQRSHTSQHSTPGGGSKMALDTIGKKDFFNLPPACEPLIQPTNTTAAAANNNSTNNANNKPTIVTVSNNSSHNNNNNLSTSPVNQSLLPSPSTHSSSRQRGGGVLVERTTHDNTWYRYAMIKQTPATPFFASADSCIGEHNGFDNDLWALAVSMYCAVCGCLPFLVIGGNTDATVVNTLEVIKTGQFRWPTNYRHQPVSSRFKELINWMLMVKPMDRPTIDMCKNHPWCGVLSYSSR